MNKYDWSNVPKEVKWIATDEDGVARGHEREPVIDHPSEWNSDQYYDYPVVSIGFKGNWQDSLEERPND